MTDTPASGPARPAEEAEEPRSHAARRCGDLDTCAPLLREAGPELAEVRTAASDDELRRISDELLREALQEPCDEQWDLEFQEADARRREALGPIPLEDEDDWGEERHPLHTR